MSYVPQFTDTARIRMQEHNLQEWQVLRAFESQTEKYGDNGTETRRAKVDGKLLTVVCKPVDAGDWLIITCWAKDLQEPDQNYRNRYGKWPRR